MGPYGLRAKRGKCCGKTPFLEYYSTIYYILHSDIWLHTSSSFQIASPLTTTLSTNTCKIYVAIATKGQPPGINPKLSNH